MSVNGGKSNLIERAEGPLPMMISMDPYISMRLVILIAPLMQRLVLALHELSVFAFASVPKTMEEA